MGWFNFARIDSYPTHYPDQHSPAHVDVLTAGFILAFIILAISLFTILPAYNGNKRWTFFSQIVISLCIGGIVVLGNYGHNWEVGSVQITSAYKSGTGAEIKGKLGLHIALRGINITLTGAPKDEFAKKELANEHIDYNEHFSWEWTQGRFGFGTYAGQFAKDYRAAVYQGLPIPILQLAEYFTFDGEGIRFGRHYKTAGYYSHIMMWLSFPTWLISNVLFCVVVRYAAMFLISTGIFQLIAISIWTFVRNPIELSVPYEYLNSEVVLSTRFGPDYYLVLVNGIVCIGLGLGIFLLDMCIPDEMCTFFGIDPLTIYDEYHLSKEEIEDEKEKKRNNQFQQTSFQQQSLSSSPAIVEEGGMMTMPETSVDETGEGETSRLVLKRRTIAGSKLFQRSFKLKEKPHIKPRIKRTPNPTTKFQEEQEMNVRTPLLKKPGTTSSSSAPTKGILAPPKQYHGGGGSGSTDEYEDDEFDTGYANFPIQTATNVPQASLPSSSSVGPPVVRRH